MSNQGHTKLKAQIISALRRLRFTNFRPLFISKVLSSLPLGRRSRSLNRYINNTHLFRKTAYASTALLALLTLAILAPIYLVPENIEAATGTATDSTLTFTSTRAAASVNLSVSSADGTFATSASSEQAAFTISTNNYTGYTLTVKSSTTGDSATKLSDGDNHTISSITNTSGISKDTFSASGDDGAAYNNMWGYLPNYYASAENTSYRPAPEITHSSDTNKSDTLRATSSANSNNGTDNPDSYTIGLGVRADYSSPAGTYTNTTFVLEYVANPVNYVITYDKNTTDTVTNMPYEDLASPNQYKQSGNTSATSITLSSLVPVRNGYNFKGWCSVQVADDSDSTACTTASGTTYNPDGDDTSLSFGIDKTVVNTATIYAMWEKASWGYIQDMDAATCESLANDANLTVTDRRDEQDYTIKYVAGKCWMTTNLNIAGGTELTSSDTNLTSGFTLPASSTSGFNSYNTDYVYNSGSTSCGNNSPCYSYYSFYTATAHWGTDSVSSGSSSVDICPKGWRLPTQSEYNTLVSSYSTGPSLVSNWSAVYSGHYYTSSFYNGGSYGAYWSSTVYGAINAYNLGFSSSNAGTFDANRYSGFAIRCIAKGPFDDFTYMQDITAAAVDAAPDGSTGTLKDNRDQQDYTVAKINGNLWMTQNLRITGTVSSTGSNFSNVSSWNVCAADLQGSSYSYTQAQCHNSGNTSTGVWYNFCAASANNSNGCNNSGNYSGSSDICPSGWRLPTLSEFQGITSSSSAFSPVTGGYYYNGSLRNTGYGYWWSSTASDADYQYRLNYNGSSLGTLFSSMSNGFYVRCIADPPIYMQDVTDDQLAALMPSDGSTTTLVDSRDGSDYQITKINGNYWMTQNLRITGTISSTGSNFSNVSSWNVCAADLQDSSDYFTQAQCHSSGNTSTGTWYNFCAASANNNNGCNDSGTYSGSSDICPSGWRLPTDSEFNNIISYKSTFSPVTGGIYHNGALDNTVLGYWWSSTAYGTSNQYVLRYDGSNLGINNIIKRFGLYVRCIRSS